MVFHSKPNKKKKEKKERKTETNKNKKKERNTIEFLNLVFLEVKRLKDHTLKVWKDYSKPSSRAIRVVSKISGHLVGY